MSILASVRGWWGRRRQRRREEYAEKHAFDADAREAVLADEQRRQQEAAEHAFRSTREPPF